MNLIATPALALQFGTWMDDGKLHFSNKVFAVSSIADASRKWSELRDRMNWGASDSPVTKVIDTSTGNEVAMISYNGRAWDLNGKEIALCAS